MLLLFNDIHVLAPQKLGYFFLWGRFFEIDVFVRFHVKQLTVAARRGDCLYSVCQRLETRQVAEVAERKSFQKLVRRAEQKRFAYRVFFSYDFDQIHLDYFKDFYFRLRHTWEIVNGLTLDIGLSIHRRTEVERSKFQFIYPETPPVKSVGEAQDPAEFPVIPAFDPELLNRFRHSYNSFAPRIALEWTPGQYYYMDGKRKVNLYSHYPTISVDWERGIGGVLPNSGSYERIEVDYQHKIALRPMHTLYYRMGWGKFTKQGDIYFVDFANLSRHNLPVGWNDEIGGVFQLLDGRWYNASREYVRGHIMYEAPFLILPHLMKYTQYVLNERIYLNALAMPHLKPYLEAGYGIGTHVFDFGVFVSFANWKYQEIGCKFTFELFNR